jgi:hypothetical protein
MAAAQGGLPIQPGNTLLTLAQQAGFNNLRPAELLLLSALPTGSWANCDGRAGPGVSSWKGANRRISAVLLQWLCTKKPLVHRISRQGILIWGAIIEGTLDLSYCEVPFPLTLNKCLFTGGLVFYSAKIPSFSLTGSHIISLQADRLRIQADLTLNEGFRSAQGVQLYGAVVAGNLSCWSGRFFAGDDNVAINATNISVGGSIFLDENFRARGEVRLYNCNVGESLTCSGATLRNPGANALDATSATIARDLRLDKHRSLNKELSAQGCIMLSGAQIGGDLICRNARLSAPPVGDVFNGGIVLNASAAQIRGVVALDYGFSADGQVNLNHCKIDTGLSCTKGTFRNPGKTALDGEVAAIGGHAMLKSATVEGAVRFYGARITGNLEFQAGTFRNPKNTALDMESAEIGGPVMLKNATVEGEARFFGAQISGDLEGVQAKVSNPAGENDSVSLNTVRATVKGSFYLKEFQAEGEVRLYGAQIGGDLFAPGATLANPNGLAVDGQNLRVSGDIDVSQSTVTGELRLIGAQIGGDLDCSGGSFDRLNLLRASIKSTFRARDWGSKKTRLLNCDLTNASVAFLDDDAGSWSKEGTLILDGFQYGQISGPSRNAQARLQWLAMQAVAPPTNADKETRQQSEFLPQPYRQLAKVLRDAGDDDGAQEVLYEMEARVRQPSEPNFWQRPLRRIWNQLLRRTIGYGVYPMRAIWWLIALTLLATSIYGLGYLNGSLTPSDKEAYAAFQKQGAPPPYYPRFNAFIFAMENTVPLLKFGQDGAWTPNAGARTQNRRPDVQFQPLAGIATFVARHAAWLTIPTFLIWFRWFEITVGWILATLFLAGVSGIVRSS